MVQIKRNLGNLQDTKWRGSKSSTPGTKKKEWILTLEQRIQNQHSGHQPQQIAHLNTKYTKIARYHSYEPIENWEFSLSVNVYTKLRKKSIALCIHERCMFFYCFDYNFRKRTCIPRMQPHKIKYCYKPQHHQSVYFKKPSKC